MRLDSACNLIRCGDLGLRFCARPPRHSFGDKNIGLSANAERRPEQYCWSASSYAAAAGGAAADVRYKASSYDIDIDTVFQFP